MSTKETIKSIPFFQPFLNFRRYLRANYDEIVWSSNLSLGQEIERNVPLFLSQQEQSNKKYLKRIKDDILFCYHFYGINPNEYFVHRFREKGWLLRRQYLSKKAKDIALMKVMNGTDPFKQLYNKFEFYTLTAPFFKRDVCRVASLEDKESFLTFCNRHSRFIAKPVASSWGEGCKIVECSDAESVFMELLSQGSWIIEELINQDERMASWNPSSVNTLRINSFRTKEGIAQIYPFMRTGRKGAIVDNGGAGGIFASVDAKTGVISTNGFDEFCNTYEVHPDSLIRYKGWQIPEWDALLELSQKVHESMPLIHKFIGFDFALSKGGWVLIEGNWGDWIAQQSTLQRGLKKYFLDYLNA